MSPFHRAVYVELTYTQCHRQDVSWKICSVDGFIGEPHNISAYCLHTVTVLVWNRIVLCLRFSALCWSSGNDPVSLHCHTRTSVVVVYGPLIINPRDNEPQLNARAGRINIPCKDDGIRRDGFSLVWKPHMRRQQDRLSSGTLSTLRPWQDQSTSCSWLSVRHSGPSLRTTKSASVTTTT